MISASDNCGRSTLLLVYSSARLDAMDNDSEPGGRARGREGAAQGARYGAHGPWPFVLYTVIIARFLWCLKLSCSVLRGELNRTPVTDGNVLTVGSSLRPSPNTSA